eukprot:gene3256-4284_t
MSFADFFLAQKTTIYPFTPHKEYIPTGDQPTAIKQLVEGINRGDRAQTLLGVTGS